MPYYDNKNQNQVHAFNVEFGDANADGNRNIPQKKAIPMSQADKIARSFAIPVVAASNMISDESKASYSYNFGNDILLNCKIENWGKGVSIFSDFIKDAKKYYKKTCINAKYIYFFSYRPTYKEMTHEQLCWYLFWRSAVRDENFIKTGLSYIFLYLYEQLNLSDIIGVEKVYKNIINIWKNYRDEFPRIDKYIAEWLIDFSLIHKIKINLDEIEDILPDLLSIVTLPEIYLQDSYYKRQNYTESLIKSVSAYDYKKSKFYTGNHEAFDFHIPRIFHAVISSAEFDEMFKNELKDGAKIKATRESYAGAVCTYENKWRITVEYRNAYKSQFFRQCVTDIIRFAENILREHLGVKSRLPITTFPDTLRPLLEEYRNKYLPPKEQGLKPRKGKKSKQSAQSEENPDTEMQTTEFNANIEMASEIEKQSWDTTITLVALQERDSGNGEDESPQNPQSEQTRFNTMAEIDTDDELFNNYENIFEIADESTDKEVKDFLNSLSETEHKVLAELVRGIPFEAMCAELLNENGVMLESYVDSINEKAMDFIGDIVYDLSVHEIIGEYADDLLRLVGAQKP